MTLSRTQIAKYVYIGQGGPLSTMPLEILGEKGIVPEAVFVTETTQHPPRLNLLPVRPPRLSGSLADMADRLDLPIIYWQKGCEDEIEAKLKKIAPDLAVMSCFPWRIPEPLLSIPVHGWWNLHPSLLPRYRGPSPLFWQAKAGEDLTGISLHQVESELDSGAIIGQQSVSLLDFQGQALESELAKQGANLIEKSLIAMAQDRLEPQQQSEAKAHYQGFPNVQDRCIELTGSASRAYRFIYLVNAAYPLWFDLDNNRYRVKQALGFDDQKTMKTPFLLDNNQLTIQFEQGVLTVLVEAE